MAFSVRLGRLTFILLAAACGGGDAGSSGSATGGGGEAGGGGAGGAGGSAEGPTTKVWVTHRDETAADGVDLVAHDANGLAVDHVITGADGSADIQIPVGGGVTAAWINESHYSSGEVSRARLLRSALGLDSPSELRFVLNRRGVAEFLDPVTLQISGSVPSDAVAVIVNATCAAFFQPAGANSNFAATAELFTCPGETKMDVVVTAYDQFQTAVSQAEFLNLSALPGTSVNISAQASHFQPLSAGTHELLGPPGYTDAQLAVTSLTDAGLVRGFGLNIAGPTSSSIDVVNPAPGASYHVEQVLDYGAYRRFRRRSVSTVPATDTFEASPLDVIVTPLSNPIEVTRPVISWVAEGTGELGDGILVTYDWSVSEPDTARTVARWRVVMPPDQTSVTLPQLPDALTAYRPTGADTALVVSRLDGAEATTAAELLPYDVIDVQGVEVSAP